MAKINGDYLDGAYDATIKDLLGDFLQIDTYQQASLFLCTTKSISI